jgi:hypothetical protein
VRSDVLATATLCWVRTDVYVGRVVQRYAKVTEAGELQVPLVLPVILHHSDPGWTAGTELAAGYGGCASAWRDRVGKGAGA